MAGIQAPQILSSPVDGLAIPIAVDPVALITTECITVTSAMRKHVRWAHSSVSAILGGVPSTSSDRNTADSTLNGKPNEKAVHRKLQVSRRASNAVDEDSSLVGTWSRRGKKGKSMQDNPLMSAFARLRSDLRGCDDLRQFDTPSLLHPFLQVIRSSSTSAPITSLAIVAITKFFDYRLIASTSLRLPLAMQLLSAAITHCRFEASDSAADEIVLLQILRLMESMISGPGGHVLSDESVCEMMETGLSMCCQKRLSELVRRSAEMSMIKMCQVIFERLNAIDLGKDDENGSGTISEGLTPNNQIIVDTAVSTAKLGVMEGANGSVLMNSEKLQEEPHVHGDHKESTAYPTGSLTKRAPPQSVKETSDGLVAQERSAKLPSEVHGPDHILDNAESATPSKNHQIRVINHKPETATAIRPYGLPSIRELFRVLVDLLRPQNKEHTDALRVMALRILDVALEVAGPSIAKHPSLASLAKDDLCRHLFQLIRTDSTQLLNESLRVAGTLLATCRAVLKLQQELFISYLVECLHPQVEIPEEPGISPKLYGGVPKTPKLVRPATSQADSGRSTPVPVKERHQLGMDGTSRKPDAREAMIESIGALSRLPGFLVELYINYDCEVDRNDLCEDLVGLLSRNAFPDSATWSTTSVPPLSLDSLLTLVHFIAERLGDKPDLEGYPDIQLLRERRARKKLVIAGATKFNIDPRAGVAYLASHGIIDNPNNPQSIAKFLKSTTRIAKKKLGEFISKRDQEPLLKAFLDLFDFSGKRVDEALRDLLNSFRLPGESQLIERIVTVFSQKYCANTTIDGIANEDAVFTLTYSIIMLNTDQHNPNLKKEKRMTLQDFAKNLRGVNGGGDFNLAYLSEIYESIKTNEIILPDEHSTNKAFQYTWEGLLVKARDAGQVILCKTNAFDADMFIATWKPIIATLSYVFMSASDDAVYSRVVLGFDQCAAIAARYGLTEVLDHIIFCLSSMSTLSSNVATNTSLNTEVQVEKRSVMVSELAVKFGRDYRAQLACVVLFRLISGKEHSIRDGWEQIVQIWLNLLANSLLSPEVTGSQHFLDLKPMALQSSNHVIDREQRNEVGLLSSFTSYISSYAADDPPEPSEEEVDSTLCTVDCLDTCPIGEIFDNILNCESSETRQYLVGALLKHLPEPSSPLVLTARPERPRQPSTRTKGQDKGFENASPKHVYNPSTAFILETCTILASRDKESMALLGEVVADALQTIVRSAPHVEPILLSRVVFYLLYLMHVSQNVQDQNLLKTPVILHHISGFEASTLEGVSDSALKGLSLCLNERTPLRSEILNSPDFWLILTGLCSIPHAAPNVFGIVQGIVTLDPIAITADNYVPTMTLLSTFATAGRIGASFEQQESRQATARGRERLSSKRPDDAHKHPATHDKQTVARALEAIILISQVVQRVPFLIEQSHLESREEAWMTYWVPMFQRLQAQCLNPCRQIRRQACSILQYALLSPHLSLSTDEQWFLVFRTVLFGLISRLLKPETQLADPAGMNETRLQAANLLCRTFLHHLPNLAESQALSVLWPEILDVLDRLMSTGQGDNLEEAIPESLKNILLVMAGAEILLPPEKGQDGSALWTQTRLRIDRIVPSLIDDLFYLEESSPKAMDANSGRAGPEQREQHVDTHESRRVSKEGSQTSDTEKVLKEG